MIFASLSLFAPPNATIVVILFVLAMSASGAIFLILDTQSAIFRIDDDLQCAIAERACFRRSSLKKFIVLARKPASVCAPAEFGQALLLPRTTNPKVRDFM